MLGPGQELSPERLKHRPVDVEERPMKRIVTGALLATSVLLPALLAVAAPAEAGVVAVSLPTAAGRDRKSVV